MNLGYIELENVCLSQILNIRNVSKHIDCRVQVFSSQYADFRATSSDAIIFKTKEFFWIFYCVSEMYMKYRTFSKKGESSSLSISEIIYSKRGGYLSAWKALPQNSFR